MDNPKRIRQILNAIITRHDNARKNAAQARDLHAYVAQYLTVWFLEEAIKRNTVLISDEVLNQQYNALSEQQ